MNTKKNCKIRIIVYSILSFVVLTAVVLSDIAAAPEIHASLEYGIYSVRTISVGMFF